MGETVTHINPIKPIMIMRMEMIMERIILMRMLMIYINKSLMT